nr:hypothetical protein [Mycobacterium leprae]
MVITQRARDHAHPGTHNGGPPLAGVPAVVVLLHAVVPVLPSFQENATAPNLAVAAIAAFYRW